MKVLCNDLDQMTVGSGAELNLRNNGDEEIFTTIAVASRLVLFL